jgi:hypothetical protein
VDEFTQQVVDAAARAVDLSDSRRGGELDFTKASLSVVEEMLAEAAQFSEELEAGQLTGLVQQFGSTSWRSVGGNSAAGIYGLMNEINRCLLSASRSFG